MVHDPARHAGEVVFGLLAEQGLFEWLEWRGDHGFEQGGGGDFQRGAAGEPAAVREGGFDDGVEAHHPLATRLEAGDNAAHVIGPPRLAAHDLG